MLNIYEGYRKNRLKAINFSHQKNYKNFWNFICDCGKIKTMSVIDVINEGNYPFTASRK